MFAVNNPLEGWQPPSREERSRAVREESEAALGTLAGAVRTEAAGLPGWQEHADKIGVYADGGESYVGLQPGDEAEQAVFDLEYGTETQAPTALLRNTLNRVGPRISRSLSTRLERRILGRP